MELGMRRKAIWLNAKDNVATALEPMKAGEEVEVSLGDENLSVQLQEDIPLAHKFALTDVAEGEPVYKYGMPIGGATQAIRKGEHVHDHNLKGFRIEYLREKYGRRA